MISKPDLSNSPIIAAVKNDEQLESALTSESEIVFILYGDILTIPEITGKVKAAGKSAIVHVDLVSGLSSREVAVDYIAKVAKADGIISTKPVLIRRGKELGLFTVLRVFIIDSMALSNISRDLKIVEPDVLEVLPGVVPEMIAKICETVSIPVIAGGLVSTKKDILAALNAGAVSISTSSQNIWHV